MENLSFKTQNTKGNRFNYKENLGYVATFLRHPQDIIIVDDFKGAGDDYMQRELSEIRIYENGTLIFKGDKYELFKKLKQ